MEQLTRERLDLFIDNTAAIKKNFFWDKSMMKRLAAFLYAQADKKADCDAIKQCKDLVKQHTSSVSFFRGDMALCIASLLSLSPDPKGLLDKMREVYDLLFKTIFHVSYYLAVAAYVIAANASPEHYAETIGRMETFYRNMKAKHFLITGQDDYIYAALLGLSDANVEELSGRIDNIYDSLKHKFINKDNVQVLALILALNGSEANPSENVLNLRKAFKDRGVGIDGAYTLPMLGFFTLLNADANDMINEIAEVTTYLRAVKGFGPASVMSQELLIYASAFIAGGYASRTQTQNSQGGAVNAAVSSAITNIIIAQQTAMIIAIITAVSASTSSS